MSQRIDLLIFGGRGSSSSSGKGKGAGGGGGIPESNIIQRHGNIKSDPFFGEVQHVSNQYYKFDQVKDADNAIIMTNNIQIIKGSAVMVTGEHTAIYLKNKQFRLMKSKDGTEAFAVKINRNNFKEYTFKGSFDFASGERDTFDSLYKVAIQQHKAGNTWKSGGMIVINNNSWRKY